MASIMSRAFITTLAGLATVQVAQGHTWIEQLRNVDSNGSYVGQYGYPRGMVDRTDPTFNGDSMNWELPVRQDRFAIFINATTPLCHTSQRKQVQSADKYPRLQAQPGGFIAMRYAENGHVSKPNNQLGKPAKGGTIFVYGTTSPIENENLADVLRWTTTGDGGDKRGVLLGTNDFDDGRCYEENETQLSQNRAKATPNYMLGQVGQGTGSGQLRCETNIKLPDSAAEGKLYTLYWVWQWNTIPGIDPGLPQGKDEYYTTCMDVDIAAAKVATAALADGGKKFAMGQQDAMSVAPADFASRTALVTDPAKAEVGPIFGSPTGASSGQASASPQPTTLRTSASPAQPTVPAAQPTSPSQTARTRTRTRTRNQPKQSATASPATTPVPAPPAQTATAPGAGDVEVTVTHTTMVTVTREVERVRSTLRA